MAIPEIDNRPPEYGRPYEKIKGVKRKKGLFLPGSGLLSTISVAVVMIAAITSFNAKKMIPNLSLSVPEQVEPANPAAENPPADQTPGQEPGEPGQPDSWEIEPGQPQDPDEPNQQPDEPDDQPDEPDQRPDNPQPNPQPDPRPRPNPTPDPTPDPDPDPTPDPDPDPDPYVPPYDPDPDPDPTPTTPKEPEISISGVRFWDHLGHVEVEYNITPNDATILSSYATVTSNADPNMTVTTNSTDGTGTVGSNLDASGSLSYLSTDEWTTVVTVTYSIKDENGNIQEKTVTATQTAQPELIAPAHMRPVDATDSGPVNARNVNAVVELASSSSDRHDYKINFNRVTLQWLMEDSDNPGVFSDENVIGTSQVIWDGTGDSPITPLGDPSSSGNTVSQRYQYTGTVNATPPDDASEATHYRLLFNYTGTGTDDDGTNYTLRYTSPVATGPLSLESKLTGPKATITGLRFWPEINHAEVLYTLTSNDGRNIESSASVEAGVESAESSTTNTSFETDGGNEDLTLNINAANTRLYALTSSDWDVELTLGYEMDGDFFDASVNTPLRPELHTTSSTATLVENVRDPLFRKPLDATIEIHVDNRHAYEVNFTKVEVGWANDDGPTGTPREIQNAAESVNLDSTQTSGSETVYTYRYEDTANVTPPADANAPLYYYLIFSYDYTAVDQEDGSDFNTYSTHHELSATTNNCKLAIAQGPTGSITGLTYWPDINHIEVAYTLTSNDARNINTSAVVSFYDLSAESGSNTSFENAGGTEDLTLNINAGNQEFYRDLSDSDTWNVELDMQYTLAGNTETYNTAATLSPQIVRHGQPTASLLENLSDPLASKLLESDIAIPVDSRHTYDVTFTKVTVVWANFDGPTGEEREIWNSNSTTYPFTQLDSTTGSDGTTLNFHYSDTADVTPSDWSNSPDNYYLVFEYTLKATDTDGSVYNSVYPQGVESSITTLAPIPTGEPTVTINSVRYWPFMEHVEVTYTVTPNRATELNHYVEIYSPSKDDSLWLEPSIDDPGQTVFVLNGENMDEQLGLEDNEQWTVTVYFGYELDGDYIDNQVSKTLRPTTYEFTVSSVTDRSNIAYLDNENIITLLQQDLTLTYTDENMTSSRSRHTMDLQEASIVIESYVYNRYTQTYEHLEDNDVYYEDGQFELTNVALSMVNGKMQISMTVSSTERKWLAQNATHFKVKYWFYGPAYDTAYDNSEYWIRDVRGESAYIPLG